MSPNISTGDVVAGRYVVGRVIGSGGAGIVFSAVHRALNKRVVLKVLRHESEPDSELAQRFVREARAAAQLRSEHVAQVLDAEIVEQSLAFIAMEYLEGRDLAQVIDQDGPLPIEEAVDLVLQASEAIAEAHARGIIHRDIKPSNLFLARAADGQQLVKVLDFGLSKLASSDMSLTSENCVIGSPHFMSPEQMRSSRDTDERTDIWALGAVLFTLLAGVCPFPGRFLTEVCAAVISGASVSLREQRPEVPEGLEAVITKCLSLDPVDRFQSVPDLATALEPYAPSNGAERSARIKRTAAAAQKEPDSEAPLSPSQRREIMAIGGDAKSPASVSAAVLLDAKPLPQRQLLTRAAALGALIFGLIGAIAVVARTSTHGIGASPIAADASAPLNMALAVSAPTQAASRTKSSAEAPLSSARTEAAPRTPAITAPSRSSAQVATPTLALRAASKGPSSPATNSPAPRSSTAPPPARRGNSAPSDEDLILSLPH